MMWLCVIFSFVLIILSSSANEHVLNLTPESFYHHLHTDSHLVVTFHSPKCSHCVQFKPLFETIAHHHHHRQASKTEKRPVKFATLDCELYGAFCQQQQILAYPTIRFYDPFQKPLESVRNRKEFKKDRTVENILHWIDRCVASYIKKENRKKKSLVQEIENTNQWLDLLHSLRKRMRENKKVQHIIVAFFASWNADSVEFVDGVFEKLASTFKGEQKQEHVLNQITFVRVDGSKNMGLRDVYEVSSQYPIVLHLHLPSKDEKKLEESFPVDEAFVSEKYSSHSFTLPSLVDYVNEKTNRKVEVVAPIQHGTKEIDDSLDDELDKFIEEEEEEEQEENIFKIDLSSLMDNMVNMFKNSDLPMKKILDDDETLRNIQRRHVDRLERMQKIHLSDF